MRQGRAARRARRQRARRPSAWILYARRPPPAVATRLQVLVPISAAAVIVGVAGILTIPSDSKLESTEFPRGTVLVDGSEIAVQVADTAPRRARGLMFQEQLPQGEGMLYVHDKPGEHARWMLNMQFAVDVVWFGADGRAVHVERGVPPCKSALEQATCTAVNPGAEALYILEVPDGYASELGIGIGSVLEVVEDAAFPRGTVSVGGTVVEVQIADTPELRARGLMFQEALPYDEGMLFVHDRPGPHSMWMPNMRFALDIVWFDAGGAVVHIERGVPPCGPEGSSLGRCPSYGPDGGAVYVLEATAGFVDMHGIDGGSVLEIISA